MASGYADKVVEMCHFPPVCLRRKNDGQVFSSYQLISSCIARGQFKLPQTMSCVRFAVDQFNQSMKADRMGSALHLILTETAHRSHSVSYNTKRADEIEKTAEIYDIQCILEAGESHFVGMFKHASELKYKADCIRENELSEIEELQSLIRGGPAAYQPPTTDAESIAQRQRKRAASPTPLEPIDGDSNLESPTVDDSLVGKRGPVCIRGTSCDRERMLLNYVYEQATHAAHTLLTSLGEDMSLWDPVTELTADVEAILTPHAFVAYSLLLTERYKSIEHGREKFMASSLLKPLEQYILFPVIWQYRIDLTLEFAVAAQK